MINRFSPRPLFFALLFANGVHAQSQVSTCEAQARSELEHSYCEIVAAGGSGALPNFEDFKKNPEKIQRLLLKREAARVGVTLPEAPVAQTRSPEPAKPASAMPSLQHCELKGEQIACAQKSYALQTNKKNNQLRASAFSAQNELRLPSKSDTDFADESDYRYLSQIYPLYIQKMLELGLGDATMSFTKFASVYWQSKVDKVDFSERFRSMYNQLKIEKSRNAVARRYTDALPESIQQCMRLDSSIIVCDNKVQNWVYKLR